MFSGSLIAFVEKIVLGLTCMVCGAVPFLHASFRTPNLKARLNSFREEFRAVWRGYSDAWDAYLWGVFNNSPYISVFLSCRGTVAALEWELEDLKLCSTLHFTNPTCFLVRRTASNLVAAAVIFYLTSLLMNVFKVYECTDIFWRWCPLIFLMEQAVTF